MGVLCFKGQLGFKQLTEWKVPVLSGGDPLVGLPCNAALLLSSVLCPGVKMGAHEGLSGWSEAQGRASGWGEGWQLAPIPLDDCDLLREFSL